MISTTDMVITKQCIIYQSQFPKEICDIIMDFIFYDMLTGQAKRKHRELNNRICRSIHFADRLSYSLDSNRKFSYPHEIYFGPKRHCAKVEFELGYYHRLRPEVCMSFIFCKQCGNYYDDNEYDAMGRAVAIKCSCYNFVNVCGICCETDINICNICRNYYNE